MVLRMYENKNKVYLSAKEWYGFMQKSLPKEERSGYTVVDAYNDMLNYGKPACVNGNCEPIWLVPEKDIPQPE